MRLAWCLVLAVSFVSGCGGSDPPPEDVAFQRLDLNFGSFAEANYVFRSQAEFSAAWAASPPVHPLNLPVEQRPAPEVDFSKNVVVGVSQGLDILCHYVRIKSVMRLGDVLAVSYVSTKGGGSTLACVHPQYLVDLVIVPGTAAAVTFTQVPE